MQDQREPAIGVWHAPERRRGFRPRLSARPYLREAWLMFPAILPAAGIELFRVLLWSIAFWGAAVTSLYLLWRAVLTGEHFDALGLAQSILAYVAGPSGIWLGLWLLSVLFLTALSSLLLDATVVQMVCDHAGGKKRDFGAALWQAGPRALAYGACDLLWNAFALIGLAGSALALAAALAAAFEPGSAGRPGVLLFTLILLPMVWAFVLITGQLLLRFGFVAAGVDNSSFGQGVLRATAVLSRHGGEALMILGAAILLWLAAALPYALLGNMLSELDPARLSWPVVLTSRIGVGLWVATLFSFLGVFVLSVFALFYGVRSGAMPVHGTGAVRESTPV